MLDTRQLTAMVAEFEGLSLGKPENTARRGEIIAALIDKENPSRTVYQTVRFFGYLNGLGNQSMFMRILQSEADRYDKVPDAHTRHDPVS